MRASHRNASPPQVCSHKHRHFAEGGGTLCAARARWVLVGEGEEGAGAGACLEEKATLPNFCVLPRSSSQVGQMTCRSATSLGWVQPPTEATRLTARARRATRRRTAGSSSGGSAGSARPGIGSGFAGKKKQQRCSCLTWGLPGRCGPREVASAAVPSTPRPQTSLAAESLLHWGASLKVTARVKRWSQWSRWAPLVPPSCCPSCPSPWSWHHSPSSLWPQAPPPLCQEREQLLPVRGLQRLRRQPGDQLRGPATVGGAPAGPAQRRAPGGRRAPRAAAGTARPAACCLPPAAGGGGGGGGSRPLGMRPCNHEVQAQPGVVCRPCPLLRCRGTRLGSPHSWGCRSRRPQQSSPQLAGLALREAVLQREAVLRSEAAGVEPRTKGCSGVLI